MTAADRAAAIAGRAHAAQTDKAGHPYVEHLGRVAARCDPDDRAAAWLHDVLEDTSETPATLSAAGIPGEVIDTVETLTRGQAETYRDYIERIRSSGNAQAVRIKRADVLDHLEHHPDAIGENQKRRYRRALKALSTATGPGRST